MLPTEDELRDLKKKLFSEFRSDFPDSHVVIFLMSGEDGVLAFDSECKINEDNWKKGRGVPDWKSLKVARRVRKYWKEFFGLFVVGPDGIDSYSNLLYEAEQQVVQKLTSILEPFSDEQHYPFGFN